MVEKLRLPFPLLSDPDGATAIKPYGVWHEERGVAKPAIFVVAPDGDVRFRQVARDMADRLAEDDLVAQVRDLDLAPTTQDPPAPGDPQPSERAFPVDGLPFYYRGAKFAATAVSMRVAEAKDEAEALIAEVERYTEAVKRLGG